MARGKQIDQKMKPYLVYEYLMKHSDEDNVVPTSELVAYLQEIGISAERRSIYRDIEEINKAILIAEELAEDIDEACELIEDDEDEKAIIYDKSKKGFYVRNRHYDLPDIRMLAECVYSAKFIDRKRANRLVDVVCDLVSEAQAETLKHDVFLTDRVKTENTAIYDIVQTITEAMSHTLGGKPHTPEKIKFKYLKCTIQNLKGQVERRGGAEYIVSPFKLLINDGNYYLLAFEGGKMKHYRVDRMKNVKRIGEKREGDEEYKKIDLESYTQSHFGMFGGISEHVTLQFIEPLLDTMVDRFGTRGVIYGKKDEKHLTLTTKIEVSDQFFGWLCGFGRRVKIVAPESVVNKFKEHLDKMRVIYE